MAHVIVEYTSNIRERADLPRLLQTVNDTLIAQPGVFPIGGIRSRAVELVDYRMADGGADYAFVHITLKMGAGREPEVKRRVCDELFAAVKAHFAQLYSERYLALSMELYEFDEGGTYKYNNVHARFRRP